MHRKISLILCIGSLIFLLLFINSCNNEHSKNQLTAYKTIQKVEPTHVNFLGHWLNEGKIEVKQFDMTNEDFLNYIKAVYEYNQKHNDSIAAVYESGFWRTTITMAQTLFFSEVGSYDEILNTKFSEKKLLAWEKVLREMERYAIYKPFSKRCETTPWRKWFR